MVILWLVYFYLKFHYCTLWRSCLEWLFRNFLRTFLHSAHWRIYCIQYSVLYSTYLSDFTYIIQSLISYNVPEAAVNWVYWLRSTFLLFKNNFCLFRIGFNIQYFYKRVWQSSEYFSIIYNCFSFVLKCFLHIWKCFMHVKKCFLSASKCFFYMLRILFGMFRNVFWPD